jgi:sugar lactone lactonase YvrE
MAVVAAAVATVVATPRAGAEPLRRELPAEPPTRETWRLTEQWRVGGEDDEDVLLGVVTHAARDERGNVYLLDRQLSQVVVVGPDGAFLGTLSREGDGPGEVRRPNGIVLLQDGRVGIIQGFPGRIVLLEPTDTPAGTIEFGAAEEGGFLMVRGAAARDGHLLVTRGRTVFDREEGKARSQSSLALCDLEGRELVRFADHELERDFEHIVNDERAEFTACDPGRWALGPGGRVYLAPARDAYLVQAFAPDGTLQMECRRPFTPRERSEEDKREMHGGMRIVIDGRRQEIDHRILDHDPPISRLSVDADGNLWISNCYDRHDELPAGALARYDVISPQGEFLREVTLNAPGTDRETDGIVFLDGRHFLVIRNQVAAIESMRAGFNDEDEDEEEGAEPEDFLTAEPLEVVLFTVAGT